jgi:hypothetical protein
MDKEHVNEKERMAYIDALLTDINNTPIEKATDGQLSYIETLIQTSSIDHDRADHILNNLESLSYTEAEELLRWLNEHQTDPIMSGRNYSQTDILNHLKKFEA